jgi:hypothetical protein
MRASIIIALVAFDIILFITVESLQNNKIYNLEHRIEALEKSK